MPGRSVKSPTRQQVGDLEGVNLNLTLRADVYGVHTDYSGIANCDVEIVKGTATIPTLPMRFYKRAAICETLLQRLVRCGNSNSNLKTQEPCNDQ